MISRLKNAKHAQMTATTFPLFGSQIAVAARYTRYVDAASSTRLSVSIPKNRISTRA